MIGTPALMSVLRDERWPGAMTLAVGGGLSCARHEIPEDSGR
jgi:hypothetical protein